MYVFGWFFPPPSAESDIVQCDVLVSGGEGDRHTPSLTAILSCTWLFVYDHRDFDLLSTLFLFRITNLINSLNRLWPKSARQLIVWEDVLEHAFSVSSTPFWLMLCGIVFFSIRLFPLSEWGITLGCIIHGISSEL